jgi:hypothetical protein
MVVRGGCPTLRDFEGWAGVLMVSGDFADAKFGFLRFIH